MRAPLGWLMYLVTFHQGMLFFAKAENEALFNIDELDFGGGDFKIDSQLAEKVRALIRHFKQDDPLGVPEGLGTPIKEPMQIPNLEHTFSGTKMKFENLSLYGLNKFRLDLVRVILSDHKENQTLQVNTDTGIGLALSIDELFVNGLYQMSSWFTKSKGNFSVTISNVSAEAEVGFAVDDYGVLQVQEVKMDVKFGDIKMNFENLGFFGSIFQGMVNSIGGFLFDSIKPMILQDVEVQVRGELNRQARSVPQQFPNSINPVDMFLASAREYMREKQLDPFIIPEYHLASWSYGNFQLTEGILQGLATIHRTGALIITFEENIVRISLHMGAENLRGDMKWKWSALRGLLKKEGIITFSVEYLTAHVLVGQPANLDKPTTIDKIDLEVGNIAVYSNGLGTLDYVLEALVNILPNLLRKQIVDFLEEPLREYVESEVRKAVEIEKIIEQRLNQNHSD